MNAPKFMGYKRKDGMIGCRNHVVAMQTVLCTGPVADRIAQLVPGVIPIVHPWCNASPETLPVLSGIGKNPNVAGLLLISLDCEDIIPDLDNLIKEISATGKLCKIINVRKSRGTVNSIEKGAKIAQKMVERYSILKREMFSLENLTIGIKCGGSDTTSGLAANPALGHAVDSMVDQGATVLFSEVSEMVGAEEIIGSRAINEDVRNKIFKVIERAAKHQLGTDGFNIKPMRRGRSISSGNIKGGLTTLEEKALGSVSKTGMLPIQGVVKFAEKPSGKGLYMMDDDGIRFGDVGDLTGFLAAGSQLTVFTTGRGSAAGTAIAPVIKVCGNPETYNYMKDNMDINASNIILEKSTHRKIGKEICHEISTVASGKKTKSEILGHIEFDYTRSYWKPE